MNPRPRTLESLSHRELTAWRNALFVAFGLSGVALSTWVARIPSVRDDLSLSTFAVGLIMLASSGGSILGLIAAPPLLTRLGPRRAIGAMLVADAAAMVAMGFGTSTLGLVSVVLAGLVVFGFGAGAADVTMNVDAASAEKALGKTILPLMHGCWSGGTVVGAGVGAAAAAWHLPVALHMTGVAVLIAAGILVAIRFIPNLLPADAELTVTGSIITPVVPPAGWREKLRIRVAVWQDTRLLLIGLVMLGMAFAEGAANDWIALATVDGHHQSNAAGAIFLGIFVTAMTVGRVAGGPFVDRFGRVAAVRGTAVLGVVGLLLFILSDLPWLAAVGTVLWGLGASLGFPLGMSAAADDQRNAAARVSAVAMIGYCAL
ncbi:MAG TPA: MFS transporter, partial [Microbacteriaceae bacterium]|nr:MFS transporter [Microbacteriaceae bacterium]